LVVSTDSFVVTPLEFKGGDIGKLAVCGTVNDVLMMGAIPKYLTCGFILETGLEIARLDRIVASMAAEARAAGVLIVAGDTKVIEGRTNADRAGGSDVGGEGLMINSTGIGFLRAGTDIARAPSAAKARPGDAVIVSGNLGDHHACILSARMGVESDIESDCASLGETTDALFRAGSEVHVLRDVTRGGLGAVLNEIADASGVTIELSERALPVDPKVAAFCGVMGLDPIYMGNEGKMVVFVPKVAAERAVALMRATEAGRGARVIGAVRETEDADDPIGSPTDPPPAPRAARGFVVMRTKIGGARRIDTLFGEGLPRIC
jgi:hydrogenase expression/formation protein HypE